MSDMSFCVDVYCKKRQNSFILAEQMYLLSGLKKVIQTGTRNSIVFMSKFKWTSIVKVHTFPSFATVYFLMLTYKSNKSECKYFIKSSCSKHLEHLIID